MAFKDMTDQELVECARRTSVGSAYRAMADRIEQRSADCLALINALHEVSTMGAAVMLPPAVRARQLLERLEESGTMAALKRIGR